MKLLFTDRRTAKFGISGREQFFRDSNNANNELAEELCSETPAFEQIKKAKCFRRIFAGGPDAGNSCDAQRFSSFDATSHQLTVSSTGSESLTVGTDNAGNVILNASIVKNGNSNLSARDVVSIVANGGTGGNRINLSGVTPISFPSLTSVTINGNGGNDTITGSSFGDLIHGNAGNDSIVAGPGDDVILGDDGNDTLVGDAGNDTLTGGNGLDTLGRQGG